MAVNHAETFNDIVSKESLREKKTLKVLNIVDAASGVHIAIQIADQTAETICKVCIKHKSGGRSEMSGYLIVRQLIKCAKEQLRMASPAEREMREMLKRIGWRRP